MRVNQVEIETVFDEFSNCWQRATRQGVWRDIHAYLWWQKISGMMDINSISMFESRRGSKFAVFSETLTSTRKPGDRRNHSGFDLATFQQLAQTRFHEDAMARPDRAWIERGKKKRLYLARHALLSASCNPMPPWTICGWKIRFNLSGNQYCLWLEPSQIRRRHQAALTSLSRSGCRSSTLSNFTKASDGLVLPFS